MEWLTEFQESFREPVFAFLGAYWPAIAALALIGAGWWLSDITRRGSTSAESGMDDSDGESGGGDGGGGGD
jgi:hypothetical protein